MVQKWAYSWFSHLGFHFAIELVHAVKKNPRTGIQVLMLPSKFLFIDLTILIVHATQAVCQLKQVRGNHAQMVCYLMNICSTLHDQLQCWM